MSRVRFIYPGEIFLQEEIFPPGGNWGWKYFLQYEIFHTVGNSRLQYLLYEWQDQLYFKTVFIVVVLSGA